MLPPPAAVHSGEARYVLDFGNAAAGRDWAEIIGVTSAALTKPTAMDTDAEVCPLFPELQWLGGALVDETSGGARWTLRVLQALTLGMAAYMAIEMPKLRAVQFDHDAPTALMRLADAVCGVAFLGVMAPLLDAPAALRPGPRGTVERLGAGVRRVSVEEATGLRRARLALHGLSMSFVIFGAVGYGVLNLLRLPAGLPVIAVVMFALVPPCLCSGWWLAMRVAAALARDAVADVARAAREAPWAPANDDADTSSVYGRDGGKTAFECARSAALAYESWRRDVAAPTLALHGGVMVPVAAGWMRGLTGVFGFFLGMAIHVTLLGLDSQQILGLERDYNREHGTQENYFENIRNIHFAMGAAYALLPLPLAIDLANISDACDDLIDTLSATARRAYARGDRDAQTRTFELTTMLDRLNLGKGLGLTLGGIRGPVLDKHFLKRTFVKLVSVLGTAYPLIVALAPAPHGAHGGAHARLCDLAPGVDAFVDACVAACLEAVHAAHASAAVSEALGANCSVVPAACAACMPPTLAGISTCGANVSWVF